MKKVLFILTFLFASFGLVACGGGSSDYESVALEFNEKSLTGKLDKALKLLYLGDEVGAGEKEMMQGKLAMWAEDVTDTHGKFKSQKVISSELSPTKDAAEVTIETTFASGHTRTEAIPLIKVDGKWYVLLR